MTAKALNRIRSLDDAAEQAGGYVMDTSKVKHDPQKLTAEDFRKAGIRGKS